MIRHIGVKKSTPRQVSMTQDIVKKKERVGGAGMTNRGPQELGQGHRDRQVSHGDGEPAPSGGAPPLARHVLHKGLGGGHSCGPAVTVTVHITLRG